MINDEKVKRYDNLIIIRLSIVLIFNLILILYKLYMVYNNINLITNNYIYLMVFVYTYIALIVQTKYILLENLIDRLEKINIDTNSNNYLDYIIFYNRLINCYNTTQKYINIPFILMIISMINVLTITLPFTLVEKNYLNLIKNTNLDLLLTGEILINLTIHVNSIVNYFEERVIRNQISKIIINKKNYIVEHINLNNKNQINKK